MSTFVLVHGAWSGAHCFRLVRPLLYQAGHDVFTPSLTGIGEREHLTGPRVDLDLHVQDVVNQLRYEDLHDVVLLGYSYGGMVVSGTVQQAGERVRELVFLDAFVPSDGQSVADLGGVAVPDAGALGAPWAVPPRPREWDDPAVAAWATERRVPHPARCFTQALRLDRPLEDGPFGLTYVKASGDPSEPLTSALWAAARRARESERWSYHEIATNHMVAENRPAELASLLLNLA